MVHLQVSVLHLFPVGPPGSTQAPLRVSVASVISTNDSHYVVML